MILLEDVSSASDVEFIAKKIMDKMSVAHHLGEVEKVVSFSIGAAMYPDDAADDKMLTQCADQAMYLAKQTGRNNFKFYQREHS